MLEKPRHPLDVCHGRQRRRLEHFGLRDPNEVFYCPANVAGAVDHARRSQVLKNSELGPFVCEEYVTPSRLGYAERYERDGGVLDDIVKSVEPASRFAHDLVARPYHT